MGQMGFGYGSEWHLLRFLGRHRNYLNDQILKAVGREGCRIEWLDFDFDPSHNLLDAELEGIGFIDHVVDAARAEQIKEEWRKFWPQSGNSMNWDAVGLLLGENNEKKEILLVEAKANTSEMISNCGVKGEDSKLKIAKALQETKTVLNVTGTGNWQERYYQYANRLAVQAFLTKHKVPSKLVYLYFYGDKVPGSVRSCPQSKEEWLPVITEKNNYLGLIEENLFERAVDVFLPVTGR